MHVCMDILAHMCVRVETQKATSSILLFPHTTIIIMFIIVIPVVIDPRAGYLQLEQLTNGCPGICLSLSPHWAGVTPHFYIGAVDLNSGPHWAASVLPPSYLHNCGESLFQET